MSAICIVCNTNYCGCGGAICANCKQKIKEIEKNPNLTREQKDQLINALYVNNNQTQ